MEIVSQLGDITQVKADAVVNPANSLGEMGGGVAGALRKAGGDDIQTEAMGKAPIPIGEAIATGAGTLPFKYVVHSPTMEKPGETSSLENIRKAVVAALLCADSFGVQILAMPGLGTGVGQLSATSAAEVIVETLRNYETASIRKVILIDREKRVVDAFREALIAERS